MQTKTSKPDVDKIVSGCVVARLRLLNRVITNIYDDALRPLGLTVNQMGLLVITHKHGVARSTDVCEMFQMDTSTLSRNIERMRNHGWLVIVPDEDARSQPFRLTAKGRKLLEKAIPGWSKAQRKAKEILGEKGFDVLDEAVNRIRSMEVSP